MITLGRNDSQFELLRSHKTRMYLLCVSANLSHNLLTSRTLAGNAPRSTDSLSRSRGTWSFSFKRSRSVQVSQPAVDGIGIYNVKNIPRITDDMVRENDVPNLKVNKKKIRTLTPTSEQLASLNLKEGRNIVIFTFSTAMLGKQQVTSNSLL